MQLVKQFSGSPSLDEYLASKLKSAFASVTDQICLYGTGAPQPTGIISTTGCHAATVTVPPTWSDLTQMRYLATNANADLSSFGWITNQKGRKYLESTPRFTNSAGSMFDFMQREAEVSLEVNDDRLFAGVWNYMVIGYWLADNEGGIAADLTFDPYSKAEKGELIITGSVWVDVSPRWPELFCYSQASVFP
jgi:hypothetical protein